MEITTLPASVALAKNIGKEKLNALYQQMTLIRAFELRIHEEVINAKLPGPAHLSAGQEAVAVGVCAHLDQDDYVASTHRGHGHCLAKGMEVTAIFAELAGKVSGCCKGKGGSLHVMDLRKARVMANAIVGGGLPIACGIGLSAKVRGTRQVAVAFLGEGATNHGYFHESLNLAAVWKLPVVFVIENNLYQDCTPYLYVTSVEQLSERSKSYNLPGETVEGMDVMAVYEAAGKMIARARRGEGASVLECRTYRYFGHYEGDPLNYRTKEEEAYYKEQRDPLKLFRAMALTSGLLTEEDLAKMDQTAQRTIEEAAQFAEAAPFPEPEDCLHDVWAD